MSGPKDYSPPPMYSMQVFDGKLNEVFKLQCQLNELLEETENMQTDDKVLNDILSIQKELNKLSELNNKALKALIFDYKGKFDQTTYNKIFKEIEQKIDLLNKQIKKLKSLKNNIQNKIADYEACQQLNEFRKNMLYTFEEFKKNTVNYISQNITSDNEQLLKEAIEKINAIELYIDEIIYKDGLRNEKDVIKNKFNTLLNVKEKEIAEIRTALSKHILNNYSSIGLNDLNKSSDNENVEIKRIIENINKIINKCEKKEIRAAYKSLLEQLEASEIKNQVYYYKELHDDLLEKEKLFKQQERLHKLLVKINKTNVHASLNEEKKNLCNDIIQLLNCGKIKDTDIEKYIASTVTFIENNRVAKQEEDVREKERLFLKMQIIHSLENMGYEVMDDLNVIDFENEDEFLLKIKGQDNYLNLKFKQDGSFRYVFQIPEKKEELTTDQQKEKLHEMQVSCDEFQSVLSELKQMGLNVNLRSEKPVALSSIISVTEKHKGKIKKTNKTQNQQNQVKKRYLND